MNGRRLFYLLALLAIVAAVIVPAVVSSQRQAGSGPAPGAVAPGVQAEGQQAAADRGDGEGASGASVDTPAGVNPQTPSSPLPSKDAGERDGSSAPGAASVAPAASPAQSPAGQQGCRVGIAVVGIGGQVLYRPAVVTVNPGNKWGITALGALDATGLTYSMKPAWPDFVDAISGQACKGVSGWMYMVNGETPMHMADKHPVKDGDKVIWWYSESMDQQPPDWNKLAGS